MGCTCCLTLARASLPRLLRFYDESNFLQIWPSSLHFICSLLVLLTTLYLLVQQNVYLPSLLFHGIKYHFAFVASQLSLWALHHRNDYNTQNPHFNTTVCTFQSVNLNASPTKPVLNKHANCTTSTQFRTPYDGSWTLMLHSYRVHQTANRQCSWPER